VVKYSPQLETAFHHFDGRVVTYDVGELDEVALA
jgi:hypothetical protein